MDRTFAAITSFPLNLQCRIGEIAPARTPLPIRGAARPPMDRGTAVEGLPWPQPEPLLSLHHDAKHIGRVAVDARRRSPVIPQKQLHLRPQWHSRNLIQPQEKLPEARKE